MRNICYFGDTTRAAIFAGVRPSNLLAQLKLLNFEFIVEKCVNFNGFACHTISKCTFGWPKNRLRNVAGYVQLKFYFLGSQYSLIDVKYTWLRRRAAME